MAREKSKLSDTVTDGIVVVTEATTGFRGLVKAPKAKDDADSGGTKNPRMVKVAATVLVDEQDSYEKLGEIRPFANSTMSSASVRTELVIEAVGSASKLASILGVSRSQPTRWRKGDESPSPQKARELIDLDHVMARALMIFPQPVALDWLTTSNSYLDGARPIDVLQLRGSTEVIDALDAAMSGAFA